MSKANDLTQDSSLHTDKSRQEINAQQISSFEPRQLEPKGYGFIIIIIISSSSHHHHHLTIFIIFPLSLSLLLFFSFLFYFSATQQSRKTCPYNLS